MIFYRPKVSYLSMDDMCSVVYNVSDKNNDDISVLVAFSFFFFFIFKGCPCFVFSLKYRGLLVYECIVHFQVSVDFFV